MELSPSFFKIITFIVLIVIILISLKIVNFFAKRLLKRQQLRSFWNKYFEVFELFVWLVFGLLSIEYFTVHNKIIAIIKNQSIICVRCFVGPWSSIVSSGNKYRWLVIVIVVLWKFLFEIEHE